MDVRRCVVRFLLPLVVLTLLGGCATSATSSPLAPAAATASVSSGDLYWANDAADGTIGRASLDGTNVNQKLITGIEDPCGVAIVGSFIYWGNIGSAVTGSSIGRANLDGTGVNESFITRTDAACGVASDGTHLYWANTSAGTGTTIGRANLDGTEAEQSFITGALGPCGVAVDSTHIYWANKGYNGAGSTIGRANLDGTGVNESFITGANSPCGVAVDSAHVYWSNYGDGGSGTTIGRANLDGTAANQSFISGAHGPCGVASDGTHLYWGNAMTSQGAGTTIGRANLDGGGVNQSFISGANGPCGLGFAAVAPSATPSAMPSATPAPATPAQTPAQTPSQSDLSAGTMVDVGGYSLYVRCAGTGSPTIVWEAGSTDSSDSVFLYLAQFASISRTCIYDRAGHGRSQDSPLGLGATESHWLLTVTNLHKLLVNAGISGPYVIAGHSLGGLYARMFAAAYPHDVVGVVLVDAVNEDLDSDASIKSCPQHPPVWGCAGDDPGSWPWAGHPSDRATDLAYVQQLTHGKVAGSLGALPLVVLSHDPALAPMGQAFEPVWTTAQQGLATASSNSVRAVAVGSPHYIMDFQPKLVIEALREVVAAARASDHTLPPCGSAFTQVGGACQ